MKSLLLSLVFAGFVATSHAQTTASISSPSTIAGATAEPLKGSNTIVIQTTDSATVALKKIARSMVLASYSVKKLNSDLGYVVMEPKNVGGGITNNSSAFIFKAVAEPGAGETLLTLTGDCDIVNSGVNRMTEHMFWAKGNLMLGKQCFTVAETIAKGYTGGTDGYKTVKR